MHGEICYLMVESCDTDTLYITCSTAGIFLNGVSSQSKHSRKQIQDIHTYLHTHRHTHTHTQTHKHCHTCSHKVIHTHLLPLSILLAFLTVISPENRLLQEHTGSRSCEQMVVVLLYLRLTLTPLIPDLCLYLYIMIMSPRCLSAH